ncbi:hypothetical protein D3C76_1557980 [compost metagenome]
MARSDFPLSKLLTNRLSNKPNLDPRELLDRNAVEEIANDSAAEAQVVAKVVVVAAVDLTVVTAEAVLSSPQQANLHLRIKCHAS